MNIRPSFVEDLSRVNFLYRFNHEDGMLDPMFALRHEQMCSLLGTRDLVCFGLPAGGPQRLFEGLPEFSGESISYGVLGTKTYRIPTGMSEPGVVSINRETGIKVVSDGRNFYCTLADFPQLEKLVLALEWPKPVTEIQELESVYWDEESIKFKKDVEFFLGAWRFFKEREIPYTRAYMLYGPPGNGKTSTIRALSNALNTSVDTFDFSHPNMIDTHFINWMGNCPVDDCSLEPANHCDDEDCDDCNQPQRQTLRLVALEDLDRFFPRDGQKQTKISLSAILNALDGVHPHTNTVIIATANHPENLDAAVLARPGRFDRKIFFSPPSHENRLSFLKRLFRKDPNVTETVLNHAAMGMDGHSYASLAELLKCSGSLAFERGSVGGELVITDEDVMGAVEEILASKEREAEFIANNLRAQEMKEERISKQLSTLDLPDSKKMRIARRLGVNAGTVVKTSSTKSSI